MQNLGFVKPGSKLTLNFDTFDGGTGASITVSDFVIGDVEIYKDVDFVTQRSSDNGLALLDDGIDVDGITGVHALSIDLADDTDNGFYACGSHYSVRVGPVTIDGQTVNFWLAEFTIGHADAILNTAITSITDQDTFVIDAGPAEADALNGCVAVIQDVASAVQFGFAVVTDYLAAPARTVQLLAGPTMTLAATDSISFFPPANPEWAGGVAHSATRGLAGTALPAAAADAAGGLPISDAGGLDLDTQLAATNEVTAARMGALTDWIDGGRLDAILDLILADTGELQADDMPGLIAALNDITAAAVWAVALTATAQAAPSTTPSADAAIMTLFDALVHGVDVTATLKTFKNNAGTVIWKKALSDDGTTYAEGESASGPA